MSIDRALGILVLLFVVTFTTLGLLLHLDSRVDRLERETVRVAQQ